MLLLCQGQSLVHMQLMSDGRIAQSKFQAILNSIQHKVRDFQMDTLISLAFNFLVVNANGDILPLDWQIDWERYFCSTLECLCKCHMFRISMTIWSRTSATKKFRGIILARLTFLIAWDFKMSGGVQQLNMPQNCLRAAQYQQTSKCIWQ